MIPSTPTTLSGTNANACTPTRISQSRGKSPSVGACALGWATRGSSSWGSSSRGREKIPVAKIVAADTEVTALATVVEEEADKSNGANKVLAGNVGDMSATCRRQGEMSPIFVPTGQFWRHGF